MATTYLFAQNYVRLQIDTRFTRTMENSTNISVVETYSLNVDFTQHLFVFNISFLYEGSLNFRGHYL